MNAYREFEMFKVKVPIRSVGTKAGKDVTYMLASTEHYPDSAWLHFKRFELCIS
jgi:hypothetical protein